MAALSDAEIQALITEPKGHVAVDELLPTRAKPGHLEGRVDLTGVNGGQFRLITRRNQIDPLDFTVVLGVMLGSSRIFRLRRHNGQGHRHTNKIEGDSFSSYHIHIATERYQDRRDTPEDGFAVPTNDYVDLRGAIELMLATCNCEAMPPGRLF